MVRLKSTVLGLSLLVTSVANAQELQVEQIPNVVTLPSEYSKNWVFAHDLNFNALVEGKVVILDVGATNHNYKGAIGASLMAGFAQSTTRPELYSAQTFYTRTTYGERSDYLVVYDTETLSPIAEINLPGGKRGQTMPTRSGFALSGNDRFAFSFNFTPAASVSIVDMVERKLLEEIQTPGCSQVYPSGETSFAMLCSNGSMSVFSVDKNGKFTGRSDTEIFNDVDNNSLFIKDAVVDGVSYFPSFKGDVQPIALGDGSAHVMNAWSLVSAEEKENNWRPGGWQIIAGGDADGNFYVLMHADGMEGSHKNGGSEVWVFDPETKQKIRTITLAEWGVSIAVTRGETPYLTVTNANMDMDVYDGRTGEHLRMIGGGATQHAFQIHPVK